MRLRKLAIGIFLGVGMVNGAEAETFWNGRLKLEKGQLTGDTSGCVKDGNKGELRCPDYYLNYEVDKGEIKKTTEVIKTNEVSEPAEGVKSEADFTLTSMSYRNGEAVVRTECVGSRRLSTLMGALMAVPKTVTLDSSLGNERKASCHTITPELCYALNKGVAQRIARNHDLKKYVESCQEYGNRLTEVYKDVAASVSPKLLLGELANAEKHFKEASKTGSTLDYSPTNVTAEITRNLGERAKQFELGIAAFSDLVTLTELCAKASGTLKPSGEAASSGPPVKKSKGTR